MLFDLIVIGGGIAGATLAASMAQVGARVLVLEAESRFRDRVRGEFLAPWGVVEAKRLGIYALLCAAGGHEVNYIAGGGGTPRDLAATTVCREPALDFYHPVVQEALLAHAAAAGAQVQRGAKARVGLEHGEATVRVSTPRGETIHRARLVVAADGRNSQVRRDAGFQLQRGLDCLQVAGILFDGLQSQADTIETWRTQWEDTASGLYALLFPQGQARVRAYIAYSVAAPFALSGAPAIPRFVEYFGQAGAPREYFEGATVAGPLASYSGTAEWVEHPYRQGVVLVGDAAATTDPTHGQGISMALRDVRVLRDCLLAHADWHDAGHAYAAAHDGYHHTLATYETWHKALWFSTGPHAVARREKAIAAWQADPSRHIDIIMSGPDIPLDEQTRRRYFAED